MNQKEYKYDVAFSFLEEDEELATQINDLLRDRLNTFIYSRKQEEIAGTDGEETFNRVFGTEARIVFVLYRKRWGETSWTRIEQTAIRNRGYEEGYDFVIFAPLDKPRSVPEWLPKNKIWVGLERWGIEGAATVIESRVQEAGGKPKEETVDAHAARLSRAIATEKKKQAFLNSEEGVKAANKEVNDLFSELKTVVAKITNGEDRISLEIEVQRNECALYGEGFTIYFHWSVSFANTLESSALYLTLWKGHVPVSGRNIFPRSKNQRMQEIELAFDQTITGRPAWREVHGRKGLFSTKELAKRGLDMLLNKIIEKQIKNR